MVVVVGGSGGGLLAAVMFSWALLLLCRCCCRTEVMGAPRSEHSGFPQSIERTSSRRKPSANSILFMAQKAHTRKNPKTLCFPNWCRFPLFFSFCRPHRKCGRSDIVDVPDDMRVHLWLRALESEDPVVWTVLMANGGKGDEEWKRLTGAKIQVWNHLRLASLTHEQTPTSGTNQLPRELVIVP